MTFTTIKKHLKNLKINNKKGIRKYNSNRMLNASFDRGQDIIICSFQNKVLDQDAEFPMEMLIPHSMTLRPKNKPQDSPRG